MTNTFAKRVIREWKMGEEKKNDVGRNRNYVTRVERKKRERGEWND